MCQDCLEPLYVGTNFASSPMLLCGKGIVKEDFFQVWHHDCGACFGKRCDGIFDLLH